MGLVKLRERAVRVNPYMYEFLFGVETLDNERADPFPNAVVYLFLLPNQDPVSGGIYDIGRRGNSVAKSVERIACWR